MNRIERLKQQMEQHKWDALLVSSVPLIRYLTGYTPDLEVGPNPMEPGPILLRIDRNDESLQGRLMIPEDYAASVKAPWIECIPYTQYDVVTPGFDRRQHFADAVRRLKMNELRKSKIGVELNWIPAAVMYGIEGETVVEDCIPVLDKLRLIKDEDELDSIKEAVRLANAGQHAVRKYAREGISEIELFGSVKSEMEKTAGKRIPLLADFISGPRTAQIGGGPSDRLLAKGDLLLSDLVPNWNGYWGDSCSVTAVGAGASSSKMKAVTEHVRQALEIAKQFVKPGTHVKEIDRAVREFLIQKGYVYPHHTGHGIGVQYHEGPLISPNGDAVLQENMVIAIEPGAYVPDEGFGVRLEDVFRITKDGFEQWTNYSQTLD